MHEDSAEPSQVSRSQLRCTQEVQVVGHGAIPFADESRSKPRQSVATPVSTTFAAASAPSFTVLPGTGFTHRNLYKAYRYDQRIEMVQLLGICTENSSDDILVENEDSFSDDFDAVDESKPLGMWNGVVLRCILRLFGGLIFLRLGVVFGTAGIPVALFIMVLCGSVAILTACSLAAIASNGEPEVGGLYYLISRNLGPRVGSAIGLLLVLSGSMALGFSSVVFAEALRDTVLEDVNLTAGGAWDSEVIALPLLVLTSAISLFGFTQTNWIQYVFLVLLIVALSSIVIGALQSSSSSYYSENSTPISSFDSSTFVELIGVIFPAFTGISAGVVLVGQLKHPSMDLANGTVISSCISSAVYIVLGILISGAAPRIDLISDPLVMAMIAPAEVLLWIGVYSSAISGAVIANSNYPLMLTALSNDAIFPMTYIFLEYPYASYAAVFLIAVVTVLVGGALSFEDGRSTLDVIAPYITCALLITYSFINYSCFTASSTFSPGWRPGFKYYHKYGALVGCILSLAMMWAVSVWATAAIFITGTTFYLFVRRRQVMVNWGTIGDALVIEKAIWSLKSLSRVQSNIKTFRPSVLALCGNPTERTEFCKFIDFLLRQQGLLAFGMVDVVPSEWRDDPAEHQNEELRFLDKWSSRRMERENCLVDMGVAAFVEDVTSYSFREGCRMLFQMVGISRLRVNTMAIGFCEEWEWSDEGSAKCLEYVNIIRDALALQLGVLIVRNWRAFDLDIDDIEGRFVDLWWLFDDGGLSLLIPHLACRNWTGLTLRVMTVSPSGKDTALLFGLLRKLRIKAQLCPVDVHADAKGNLIPSKEAMDDYYHRFPWAAEMRNRADTAQFVHIGELITNTSTDAMVIFVSMPVPTVALSSPLFMSWVDILSSNCAPTVLIRGNQKNVLTFEI